MNTYQLTCLVCGTRTPIDWQAPVVRPPEGWREIQVRPALTRTGRAPGAIGGYVCSESCAIAAIVRSYTPASEPDEARRRARQAARP